MDIVPPVVTGVVGSTRSFCYISIEFIDYYSTRCVPDDARFRRWPTRLGLAAT
jgi:hypothetical protein